jgi:NADH-quinone oxidoreductase subunit M
MPHVLNVLVWLPIIAGVLLLAFGKDKNQTLLQGLSLFVVLITLAICWPLLSNFDSSAFAMQYVDDFAWMPYFGVRYTLGVDGLSLILIALTIFTNIVVILATWHSIHNKIAYYLSAFLIMQGLLVGVFAAMDAVVFYVFFEATLIPMYLIIGIFGSSNRVYASIKFFLYTFLGSVFMLLAFLYLGQQAGSFKIETLYSIKLPMLSQIFIFIAFFLGFAIKIPMFPVHTWLPDAHTEAPAGGSIVLAAILLKLGAYGFIRFALPIVPDASNKFSLVMIVLSLIAIVYVGAIAIIQKDMKKLIAYSSISHMGFVTLGCFAIFPVINNINIASMLLEGAIVVMVSHAFVSSGLFAGVGFIYDRMHTREIKDFGGVVNSMPVYASFMMLFAMANAGLPGTSGFVGEFMVIIAAMSDYFWVAFFAAITLIFGASYTLWMYKRVIFGATANQKIAELKDLYWYELCAYILLAFMVLFIGIYPKVLLDYIHPTVLHTLELSSKSKISNY